MANTYDLSIVDSLILAEIDLNDSYYGSIPSANIYFANRLKSDNWTNASDKDKSLALLEATERLERLRWDGEKVAEDQALSFPRKYITKTPNQSINFSQEPTYITQDSIPLDIIKAAYEEALSILSDDDQEAAYKAEKLSQGRILNIEQSYFNVGMRSNVLAGILSMRAWRLLMPYLKDDQEVTLIRV